jgi:two-component system, NarL family, sensor histidine kinase DesK
VAERERISRDMHDVLGHTLTAIALKSELAEKLIDTDVVRAAQEIRDVARITRESLGELRAAIAGYRAAGIEAELGRARSALESAGLRVECEVESVSLTSEQEGVLALAVREGVTNVIRHAKARERVRCGCATRARAARSRFTMMAKPSRHRKASDSSACASGSRRSAVRSCATSLRARASS